jgi:hypothetical protein
MASFGMVYSGAPLFMWIYSTKAAVFGNNITASYYSRQGVWSTAYEIVHSERFADSSIVVPFGCAALVLLTESERQKFRTRCALMIFLHYADDHPLFTYAFYSPKTKRVVHRQDVIFLVSVFPMRSARSASGFHVEGDALVTYRSPPVCEVMFRTSCRFTIGARSIHYPISMVRFLVSSSPLLPNFVRFLLQ